MKRALSIIIILMLLPSLAWPISLMPPLDDPSVIALGTVFGVVNGVLHGTGSQILGQMFGQFNSAVLALGGVIIVYTTLIGILNTAQEGEFMGKKYNSLFVPLRTVMAILLIAPTSTGYSWIQVFVMWIVLQGVGAANLVWTSATNYLLNGGAVFSQGQSVDSSAGNTIRNQLNNLSSATTCLQALQGGINEAIYNGTGQLTPPTQTALESVLTSLDPNASTNKILMPNFKDAPWSALNGICGSISDIHAAGDNDSLGVFSAGSSSNRQATLIAIRQVIIDVATATNTFVNSPCSSNCYNDSANIFDISTQTNCPSGGFTPVSTGNCNGGNGSQCAPFGLSLQDNSQPLSSTNQPVSYAFGNSPTSSVYATSKTPVISWCNKYDPSSQPMLNQTYIMAVLDYLGLTYSKDLSILNQNSINDKLKEAQSAGWFMAGAYYYALVNANTNAANGQGGGSFDVNAPGSAPNCSTLATGDFYTMTPDFISCYLKNGIITNNNGAAGSGTSSASTSTSLVNYAPGFYAWMLPFLGANSKGPNSTPGHNNVLQQFQQQQASGGKYSLDSMPDVNFSNAGGGGLILEILSLILPGPMTVLHSFASTVLGSNPNPIYTMIGFGAGLMQAALAAWIAIGALIFGVTFGMAFAISFSFANAGVAVAVALIPLVAGVLLPMFVVGAMLVYYLPLVPMMIFSFGVIGWIVAVIESMVAAPIVGFALLSPEGHDIFGKSEQALSLLLNLFLRPSLMIFGLVTGIMVSYIGIYIINNAFGIAINSIMAKMVMSGLPVLGWLANWLISLVAIPAIYTLMVMQVINRSFTLIYVLPDKVTRWISGGVQETFGSDFSGMEKDLQQSMHKGFESFGSAASSASQNTTTATSLYDSSKQNQENKGRKIGSGSGNAAASGSPSDPPKS